MVRVLQFFSLIKSLHKGHFQRPSRDCDGLGRPMRQELPSPGTGEVPPGGMAMENLWLWGQKESGSLRWTDLRWMDPGQV